MPKYTVPSVKMPLERKLRQAIYREVIVNRIQCKSCDQVITSTHRHDYVSCKCGKVSVDGGLDYCKRGGDVPNGYVELSIAKPMDMPLIKEILEQVRNLPGGTHLSHAEAVGLSDLTEMLMDIAQDYYSTVDYNFESEKIPQL